MNSLGKAHKNRRYYQLYVVSIKPYFVLKFERTLIFKYNKHYIQN